MNLSPVPHRLIRTPQNLTSSKTLQLTPIWQEVVKNNRLPPEINQNLIFKEISQRLEDLEWPVRQHGLRVLYDIIPTIPKYCLDEGIASNNILIKLVVNLGHPAPGIRKVALQTIQKYLKTTRQFEKMLEDFIQYGVEEKDLVIADQAGILRENITLGAIISLAEVLKPFLVVENEDYTISQQFLAKIIVALIAKSQNALYKEKCVEALWKLHDILGESRFGNIIKNFQERESVMNLMNQKFAHLEESCWSDETKSENSYGLVMSRESDSFDLDFQQSDNKRANEKEKKVANDSSEEYSDVTDTDTYTKEPAPNDLEDDSIYYHVNRVEMSNHMVPSFVPIDSNLTCESEFNKNLENKKDDCTEKLIKSAPSSPRVVLEAEIQFAKNKAITMKVMEDETDETINQNQENLAKNSGEKFLTDSGDLVMKVLHNDEKEEDDDKVKTPRRVRFGGEVIKLRTPDSDTTDITIEIHETEDQKSYKKEPLRETITIKQEKPVKLEAPEKKSSPSYIPLPVVPATKCPGRDIGSQRSVKDPILFKKIGNENSLLVKKDSFDSAPSSSGSEADFKDKLVETSLFWHWTELRLVEENILKDLKNKEHWKIQYQALEQLKMVLINPKTIERLEKVKNQDLLNSLVKCLLYQFPQSNNQQVTALALSIVTQLIETLPKEIIHLFVEDIVQGLCRYVGGCKNINLKIESVQSLKTLFGALEPSSVIDVLTGDTCLFSSSSKLRENSLLAIMYATMTFPSDYFDMNKLLEKVSNSTADIRRRVRHAALEAIAVLSQFCSSKILTDNIGRVAESLPTPLARAQLIAAVQARLSRRLLPTISNEGLVLYALQIPASRRFGSMGSPMGADVDWILSGTGSVSTGSAKSKSQLNAAKRLEYKSTAPLSPNKWTVSDRSGRNQISPAASDANPWTIQKNRTEALTLETIEDLGRSSGERFYKAQSTGNLYFRGTSKGIKLEETQIEEKNTHRMNFNGENGIRPEEITWALIPISALEESHLGREKSSNLWSDSLSGNSQYFSSAIGPLRPLYLKLQPSHDYLLSRSSDDVRRNSYSYEGMKNLEELGDKNFTELRLLTPTIFREKKTAESYYQNKKLMKSDVRNNSENTRIPALNSRTGYRGSRSTTAHENDRKSSDSNDITSSTLKPVELSNVSNNFSGSPTFLPNIHTRQADNNYCGQKPVIINKFEDVDETKLQDTMTQLSGLLTTPKNLIKSGNRGFYSTKNQLDEIEVISNLDNQPENDDTLEDKINNKLFDRSYVKNHSTLPNSVSSAPAVISSEVGEQIPSTSSSNSTDFGTLSASELRLRRLTNESGALEHNGGLPLINYHTYNSKLKKGKIFLSKNSNKVGINGNSFPDNLKPFERPKEGLDTCFNQLESQQWEVNMLGLTSLIRLLRHHPAIVLSQSHSIVVALSRQIRNLRSQVARAACQVSAEMFLILKRNVEPDLDELSGPLFHRSADTNRFIRADCNHALDNMVENVGHAKAISVIISKGTTHQNATVRAVAARLLLKVTEKIGPEKLLSLPKDTRDKMLQTGAHLLMEGKLETRAFAKQVFRVWSSHSSFSSLIIEAVPPNIMRHISKTLVSLKS